MTGEDCGHELHCLDGKKSECGLHGKWTNCREVGHCVLGEATDTTEETEDE